MAAAEAAAGASKKALRQQRQRANKQKRKATDVAPGASAKRPRVELTLLGADAYREAHQIEVLGACTEPLQSFRCAQAPLGTALVRQMGRHGFVAPTPIQAQAWPLALEGRDLVAVSETGSGKTCAFLLPVLARILERGPAPRPLEEAPARPCALVLGPTRELVQQIAAEANRFLVGPPDKRPRHVAVFGGVDKLDQIKKLRKGADLVVATPGRLLDFAKGDKAKGFPKYVKLSSVTYLVLDEADRLLDMGFEADLRAIVAKCPEPGEAHEGGGAAGPDAAKRRQTLLFTATWPKAVQRVSAELTRDAVHLRIRQGAEEDRFATSSTVAQVVKVVTAEKKLKRLRKLLASDLQPAETAIVFAETRETCDLLESELRDSFDGWFGVLHAGREQKQRDKTLRKFRSLTAGEGDARAVLVATDVAARGLDIPGVALVVIYDFGYGRNSGVESYVHRIGRTARAGRAGRSVTFFTQEDRSGAAQLVNLLRNADQAVPAELLQLAE